MSTQDVSTPIAIDDWSPPPGVPRYRSSYLRHLPGIYEGNEFLARFLLIFETILSPIHRTVDNLPHYWDPRLAPPQLLGWLGSWLGLVLDERWPEERRRELIAAAADLYRWRGTRRGMGEFIRLYTGFTPEIVEPTLSDVSADRTRAYRFTVRVTVPRDQAVDRSLLERIIDLEKPAFAASTLEIVRG
ncbi:MAG: phage tail protein [Dehalococcoidia bacterium]